MAPHSATCRIVGCGEVVTIRTFRTAELADHVREWHPEMVEDDNDMDKYVDIFFAPESSA